MGLRALWRGTKHGSQVVRAPREVLRGIDYRLYFFADCAASYRIAKIKTNDTTARALSSLLKKKKHTHVYALVSCSLASLFSYGFKHDTSAFTFNLYIHKTEH